MRSRSVILLKLLYFAVAKGDIILRNFVMGEKKRLLMRSLCHLVGFRIRFLTIKWK